MGRFHMKIAGCTAQVTTTFGSTMEYFRSYLTEEPAAFSIAPTAEDREFEQCASIAEAMELGIRPRTYTGPHLERAAIQRAFAEFLFDRDILLFHGSAVALDGEGFVFTAGCGTGKSTHTRLWQEVFGSRAVIINDDKPFLTLGKDAISVSGSPWSGKHGLDSNITVPLGGICVLTRGPENRIRPISAPEALPMLLSQTYRPLDHGKTARWEELVRGIAGMVPLWHMECTRDPDAARISQAAMSRQKAPD